MAERAKTVCHMFVTIDGNPISDLMWDEKLGDSVEVYNRIMLGDGDAFGAGRATMQMDITVDMSPYQNTEVSYEDVIVPTEEEPFCFIIDRFGKLRWESNRYEEEGSVNSRIIEVLTEQAPAESIAYYNAMDIPYLFAGKDNFDPRLFLEKINQYYGIKTFMLSGGPRINGVFAKAGLIDEISLVVDPHLDGGAKIEPFILAEGLQNPDFRYKLKEVKVVENDILVLRYTK